MKVYQDGFYCVIECSSDIFYNIPYNLISRATENFDMTSKSFYLLGNEEEESILKNLGVDIEFGCTDYYKIELEDKK